MSYFSLIFNFFRVILKTGKLLKTPSRRCSASGLAFYNIFKYPIDLNYVVKEKKTMLGTFEAKSTIDYNTSNIAH